jgi:hypothetical protein
VCTTILNELCFINISKEAAVRVAKKKFPYAHHLLRKKKYRSYFYAEDKTVVAVVPNVSGNKNHDIIMRNKREKDRKPRNVIKRVFMRIIHFLFCHEIF